MIVFLVLYTIFISFLFIYLLKILDIRNIYGEFILKLRKRNGILFIYIVFLVIWIFLLAYNIIKLDKYSNFPGVLNSITWILLSLVHISRAVKYSDIRERGIYLERGFYDWSKIYSYEWISSDTIEFKAKGSMLGDFEEKIEVHYVNKEKVDEILRRYVNPSFPTSS